MYVKFPGEQVKVTREVSRPGVMRTSGSFGRFQCFNDLPLATEIPNSKKSRLIVREAKRTAPPITSYSVSIPTFPFG